ncbi:MAG: pilus assembly protein PilP [Wenzhouxiangellaceae bacterium]|nr:pilus assembly protein PilP [Wenzhouxiangellaceae bacterium]
MKTLPMVLTLITACLLLVGCAGDKRDLEQYVNEVLARPPAPVDPLPEIAAPETFIYAAYDVRDPFSRMRPGDDPAMASSADGPRPDPNRRREFLERFALDALDMVGSIEYQERNYALVADVDGTIHRVREGNYLGQNHGRILRITPVAIEVMELVPNGSGGWMEREARIALPDDQRG